MTQRVTTLYAGRPCYYCGRPGASIAWPSPGAHSLVWACSDRIECTRRARQIAARRVSAPGAGA